MILKAWTFIFFFQAEDGIRDSSTSRGLGDVYKRQNLIYRLTQKKIPSVIYYKFPIHLMEAFQYLGFQKGSLPISENLSNSIVSLPMHPYLTEADIDFIVHTIQTK